MAAPDYVDGVNASALLTAVSGTVKQMIDGAEFCLEALRLGHQQHMSQFSAVAAAAQRHLEESGAGRARQTSNEPPANR